MSDKASAWNPSTRRALRLVVRPELQIDRHRYLGREYWIVKDPLTLKYYRFEDEEYALLRMLDGETSLDQLQQRFQKQFAPQQIGLGELHRFIGTLYRSSLLVSQASGQGRELEQRARDQRRRKRRAAWSNVLAVRFRGVDPDRMLDGLARRVGWLFSLPMVLLSLLVMLSAGLLLAVEFDVFRARLPEFQQFFAARNWLALGLTLAVTKVLHEFAHGLACKRFGGGCHEMGLMLLVFMPCLYCNVSDAWMLPSKWRRAAIAAAGIYVELLLAACATWIWWYTHPGGLHYLCLNVMFVCSVSTVLFNANPLLRYDGYYILSDLIEIPNLRQKASAVLRRLAGSSLLGLTQSPDPFLPQRRRGWFAAYAVAAAAYRWFIAFSIFWFVYRLFEPYGLKIVGQLIAATALYSLLVAPLVQLFRFLHVPGRMERVKPLRVTLTAAALATLLFGIGYLPLPHRVACPLYVQPAGVAPVYVDVSGTLEAVHVRPGDTVRQGQPLVTLVDDDLEDTLLALEGQLQLAEADVHYARMVAAYDPERFDEVVETEKHAESLRTQFEQRARDRQRLVVRAPRDGIVLPPAHVSSRVDEREEGLLANWHGTPLETRNLGAYLTAGTPLAQIGNPDHLEAVLAVNQADVPRLLEGQPVEIQLKQTRTRPLTTRIERISRNKMREVPSGLDAEFGGDLPTRVTPAGRRVPHAPTYQASCPLPEIAQLPSVANGATGTAWVVVGRRTLGGHLWEWACRTFRFEL